MRLKQSGRNVEEAIMENPTKGQLDPVLFRLSIRASAYLLCWTIRVYWG